MICLLFKRSTLPAEVVEGAGEKIRETILESIAVIQR